MGFQEPQPFDWHLAELSHKLQFKGHGFYLILVFFSLISLMTSLFLCIHWACQSRRRNLSLVSPSDPSVILPSGTVGSSLGLDADTIRCLPVVLHCSLGSGAKGTEECSICLGAFEEDQKVRVLPRCNHAYHSECVDKWLATHSSCPLCRNSLQIDTPDLESGIP